MSFLGKHYTEVLRPALRKDLNLSCDLAVPRLEKIVLNMGVGRLAVRDSKALDLAFDSLKAIAGQCPVVVKARRSVAVFKLREGMPIGVKVTLRKARMYEFLDRLVCMVLPRLPRYQGNKKSFDGRGNHSFGIHDISLFYELDHLLTSATMGLDVCMTTTARSDEHCLALLRGFNIPFVGEK